MKKFLLIIFIFFVLIFGGLFFLVLHTFNAETFQQQVIKNVTELTGREFHVVGNTQVNWFPFPKIVLNDVSLANEATSPRGIMFKAPKIAIYINWTSLLSNPLVIQKIEIDEPTLFLNRTESDKTNWNFPFLYQSNTPSLDDELLGTQNYQTLINTISIQKGAIEYVNDITNQRFEISNITGDLALDTLRGPYTFNGDLTLFKQPIHVKTSVNTFDPKKTTAFSLSLAEDQKQLEVDLNGALSIDAKTGTKLTAGGSFSIQNPNNWLKNFGQKQLPEALNLPSSGSISYETADGLDQYKNFTIRFGDKDDAVAMNGSLFHKRTEGKDQYTGTLAINTFDYQLWRPLFADLSWNQITASKSPDFQIKLDFPKIVTPTAFWQDFSAEFEKTGDRFSIKNGKAATIGDTLLTFDGHSKTENESNGLVLFFVGKSENFKELISTYIPVTKAQPNTLKQAELKGNIQIFPKFIEADISSFTLDKGKLSGKINIAKSEKKPRITLNLSLDSFDFDSYTGFKPSAEKTDITRLPVLIRDQIKELTPLTKADWDFNLSVQNTRIKSLPVNEATLVGKTENNTLKIEKLVTKNLATAQITLSGSFAQPGTDKTTVTDLNLSVKTPTLNLFLDKMNLTTSEEFLKTAKEVSAELTVSEQTDFWKSTLKSKFGAFELSWNGNIQTNKETPVYQDFDITMSHPKFKVFAKEFPYLEDVNESLGGAFRLNFLLNGTKQNLTFKNGELQIGKNRLNIEGAYHGEEDGLWDIAIKAPVFDIRQYIWNDLRTITLYGNDASKKIPLKNLAAKNQHIKVETNQLIFDELHLENASLDVTLQNKKLSLNEMKGTIGTQNAPFTLSGLYNFEEKTPTLSFNLTGTKLPLRDNIITMNGNKALGGGDLDITVEARGEGISPQGIIRSLSGKGTYGIKDLSWIGVSLDKVEPLVDRSVRNGVSKNVFDKALIQLLSSGKTTINSVSGNFTINNGIAQAMDTALTGNGFKSDPMQINWDLSQRTLKMSVPLSLDEKPDLPPFALTVEGDINKLTYLTNFVDLSASVADIVQTNNAQIQQEEHQRQQKEEQEQRSERKEKAQQLITQARLAVRTASEKVTSGDNQRASDLLQNARDALDVMNNLSVKDTLTDAEYMTLTEQARLAVLKANEALNTTSADKFFEDRKQIRAFAAQANEMQKEIERIENQNPDVEIIHKLKPLTAEHANKLLELNKLSQQESSDTEHKNTMKAAQNAYQKVVKGYHYVLRFDPNAIPIQPILIQEQESTTEPQKTVDQESASNEGTPVEAHIERTVSAAEIRQKIQLASPEIPVEIKQPKITLKEEEPQQPIETADNETLIKIGSRISRTYPIYDVSSKKQNTSAGVNENETNQSLDQDIELREMTIGKKPKGIIMRAH